MSFSGSIGRGQKLSWLSLSPAIVSAILAGEVGQTRQAEQPPLHQLADAESRPQTEVGSQEVERVHQTELVHLHTPLHCSVPQRSTSVLLAATSCWNSTVILAPRTSGCEDPAAHGTEWDGSEHVVTQYGAGVRGGAGRGAVGGQRARHQTCTAQATPSSKFRRIYLITLEKFRSALPEFGD